ncbi:ASCH domain-containing protein [Tumidithrix helvetica PCC 7403]|uniref:ASCH domain-containing protein n=1 Tax=Tumidithrix helvetica TaxID=3457545 RepID=UPI003C8B479C
MNKQAVEAYWQVYLATRSDEAAAYLVNQFGDRPQLADALAQLVLAGIKTATCSSLWEWEAEGSVLPKMGLKTIVLDGNHHPLCIIEIMGITIQAFSQMDDQFAYDEGEGDRSLIHHSGDAILMVKEMT